MSVHKKAGLIGTIFDDDSLEIAQESSDSEDEVVEKKKKVKPKKGKEFSNSFIFSEQDDPFKGFKTINLKFAKKSQVSTTLDDKIAQTRKKKSKEKLGEEGGGDLDENIPDFDVKPSSVDEDEIDEDVESDGEDFKADTIKDKKKKRKKNAPDSDDDMNEPKVEFSEDISTYDKDMSFQDMSISRPLLKSLSQLNFEKPTPIQAATIPVALLGRDICACAVTGSGKTVAFMLPILERLLFKPKQTPVTRVLILVPTRELAVQVHKVGKHLANYTNIEIILSTGGLDLKQQEAALRLGPDIVIATPGRLIDHLHNSPSFSLHNIEILVLDEADRMLDEYFAEQMKEVIRLCSRTRQTMLFSATMSEQVKDLAAVSLSKPVRVFVNENTDVALNLRQEFIRIRANKEGDREAIVSALVSRTFQDHCIVFIQTKKHAHRLHIILGLLGVKVGELHGNLTQAQGVFIQTKKHAHRLHIILGLLGVKVGELHGNLTQAQRLDTLEKFKTADIDVLLATDLAARGLDIQGVKTVINFTMPNTIKHYIHRVGRTARAGKSGRSVTLVGEKERKLLKEIVKKARTPLKTRIVPQDVVTKYRQQISGMEKDIEEIEILEKEEKIMQSTENQMNNAKKMLENKKTLDLSKFKDVITKYRQKISGMEKDIEEIEIQEKEEKIMQSTENQMNNAKKMLENKKTQEPERVWFQSRKERMAEKASLRLTELVLPNKKKGKRGKGEEKAKPEKPTGEDRTNRDLEKAQLYMVRNAKKSYKQKRSRACAEDDDKKQSNGPSKKKKRKAFDHELTDTGKKAVKQFRAGPSYQERKDLGWIGKKNKANKMRRK